MLRIRDKLVSLLWYVSVRTNSKYHRNRPVILLGAVLKWIHYFVCILTCNDLSVEVGMEKRVKLYHAIGIIVGSNVEFGNNVVLRAHVVLGEKIIGSEEGPVIMDNVSFGIGAKAFGRVLIDSNRFIKSGQIIS